MHPSSRVLSNSLKRFTTRRSDDVIDKSDSAGKLTCPSSSSPDLSLTEDSTADRMSTPSSLQSDRMFTPSSLQSLADSLTTTSMTDLRVVSMDRSLSTCASLAGQDQEDCVRHEERNTLMLPAAYKDPEVDD